MPNNTATRVLDILTSEGYTAFVIRVGSQTRLITDAPSHVVSSVRSLVGGR